MTQTTEREEYLDAVDVLIGAKPSRFCIPVGYRVETRKGSGIIAEVCSLLNADDQVTGTGYIVKMDESEICHHGVKLFFAHSEVLRWKRQ